jgi:transcriptional regulator with XRE-family HTH domain
MAAKPLTPLERAKASGLRIETALRHAGCTEFDLCGLFQMSRRTASFWLLGKSEPFAAQYLAIAELCGVDARWLATGVPSPAANAATARIKGVFEHWQNIMSADSKTAVKAVLEATIQPDLGPGVCRYCLCMDHRACDGGCSWVDSDHTICSACLQPREDADGDN